MDTCVRCGAALGVGRFCLNCGHPIGEPAPASAAPVTTAPAQEAPVAPADPARHTAPVVMPVQAADPTAIAPATAPLGAPVEPVAPAGPVGVTRTEPEQVPAARASTSTWDPREELLPYEEVDELDVEDPVPGRAWILWVLGAVLLVGLVFVLLETFGTDDDEGAATDPTTSESSAPTDGSTGDSTDGSDAGSGAGSDAGSGESEAEEPTGVGRQVDLARGATFEVPGTAPPTTDFDGNLVAYEAVQMHDGEPSTTWRVEGDATGQTVTITLAEPAVVYRVGMVNGYAKQVAGVDWYPNNRRVLAVTWGFEDGTTVEQSFAERPTMQLMKVQPVETSTVTITITSVTPPGTGNLGRDYTAISEVAISGRRAG